MRIDFTEVETRFLQKEFGLSRQELAELSEDDLIRIADECFDIELEGELSSGSRMPDRCGIAAGIVTKVNELF